MTTMKECEQRVLMAARLWERQILSMPSTTVLSLASIPLLQAIAVMQEREGWEVESAHAAIQELRTVSKRKDPK